MSNERKFILYDSSIISNTDTLGSNESVPALEVTPIDSSVLDKDYEGMKV